MSEDLTDYLLDAGIRTRYLHSEVDTLKRIELLRDLRLGDYDVLVGINLLREGLDLPEVSLVVDPRRRQGGLPALRQVADPDDRPGGPQRLRPGAHVRRQDHALDGVGDRRDQPAPRQAGRLQHRPRRRPDAAAQEDRRHHRDAGPRGRVAPRRCSRPGPAPRPRAAPAASRPGSRCPRCRKSTPASTPPTWPGMPSADLAQLIQDLTDQMKDAAAELQFEVAARLRDEISEPQEGAPPDDGGDEVRSNADRGTRSGDCDERGAAGAKRALATK